MLNPDSVQSTLDMWAPKSEPTGLPDDAFARWKQATIAVREIAGRNGLTKSEVARRADVPLSTFAQWFDGIYSGKFDAITARVCKWLDAAEERARLASDIRVPGYVATPTAQRVWHALTVAQTLPDIAIITLGPGMGKTMTANHYASTRPHAVLVTMRPSTSKVHGLLTDLSIALGIVEWSPAKLDRAIGEQLKRNGRHTLLMVDEAQNLDDNAVNQLRHYHDIYHCGLALIGNKEFYGRFGGVEPKERYAQLHRRFGPRVLRLQPDPRDIDMMIAAWNFADDEVNNLLRAIGRKPGALGQITKTVTMAALLAAGEGKPLSAEHVREAWRNRGGEDLRDGGRS